MRVRAAFLALAAGGLLMAGCSAEMVQLEDPPIDGSGDLGNVNTDPGAEAGDDARPIDPDASGEVASPAADGGKADGADSGSPSTGGGADAADGAPGDGAGREGGPGSDGGPGDGAVPDAPRADAPIAVPDANDAGGGGGGVDAEDESGRHGGGGTSG